MVRSGLWCVPSLIVVGALAVLIASGNATAAPSIDRQAAGFWRAATEADVAAAYDLLRDNHPAAAPEVGDERFRTALEAAHRAAEARAIQVDSYDGYAATLTELAHAMGDKHIWSRPMYALARPEWAGLLTAKRGARWMVVDAEPAAAELLGADLVSCDGKSPEDLARQSLAKFRADWTVTAQQTQTAPWLLIDEHNPFAPRPTACVFAKDGRQISRTLAWQEIAREALAPRIRKAIGIGAAGFGVRAVGGGYWIGLQSLDDRAIPVVAEVQARAEALRTAPFVVLDLRGNGGGSSQFGDEIARTLFGPARVEAVMGSAASGCGTEWRTSEGNIRQIQQYLDVEGPMRGEAFRKEMSALLAKAKAAKARGQAFTGPVTCSSAGRSASAGAPVIPPSLLKGRLVLLTDNVCFSSCLLVTDLFRRLGALHVGQATDAATHYLEVREIRLPSGLGWFSTLQAVAPGEPARIGPFAPSIPYVGDIADTAALERWVETLAPT